jgi:predicted transcriptional regulator
MPKVNMDKIQEFLKTLSDIGLLDQANGTALSITTKVSHITS